MKKRRSRSLALSVLTWMLLVALVPLLAMAIQGPHCASEAIVDLESTHQRMVLQTRRARIDDWLSERTVYCDLLDYVQSKSHLYESIAAFDYRHGRGD